MTNSEPKGVRRLVDTGALRRARKAAGYTQAELAEAVDVARDSVGKIERGTLQPSPDLAGRIAETVGVEVDDLYTVGVPTGALSEREQEVVAALRSMREEDAQFVSAIALGIAEGGSRDAAVQSARVYLRLHRRRFSESATEQRRR